jgi:hypothetical protein
VTAGESGGLRSQAGGGGGRTQVVQQGAGKMVTAWVSTWCDAGCRVLRKTVPAASTMCCRVLLTSAAQAICLAAVS